MCVETLSLIVVFYENMDNGKYTGVVFLDPEKAFGTVDHGILLSKLGKYGISPDAVPWFNHYLSNHIQVTKCQGKLSEPLVNMCGVPQGSILGPLLFILYIDDLNDYLTESRIGLYADDTALYYSSNSPVELMLTLKIELDTVYEWLKACKLTMNVKKTKYVIFGTTHKLRQLGEVDLSIGNTPIERVNSFKYLGVLLDESLTVNEHIDFLLNKASRKLGVLHKVRKCID